MKCIIDIETADWPRPCYTKGPQGLWPPLASISWCLTGGQTLSYIVKPIHWTFNPDLTAKTFLTKEYALEAGVDIVDIFRLLKKDLSNCENVIMYEYSKYNILKHAIQKYYNFDLPKLISIQDIFTNANKSWLIVGTLKKPKLIESLTLLFDDIKPQEPITSFSTVSILKEMIQYKPKWPTQLNLVLNNIIN